MNFTHAACKPFHNNNCGPSSNKVGHPRLTPQQTLTQTERNLSVELLLTVDLNWHQRHLLNPKHGNSVEFKILF